MEKIGKFCGDCFGNLMNLNDDIVTEYMPKVLMGMPRLVAVVPWLVFSVLWIVVAGPITYVVEAVMAPVCLWYENRSEPFLPRVGFVLFMCCYMTMEFVLLRFVRCGILFMRAVLRCERFLEMW